MAIVILVILIILAAAFLVVYEENQVTVNANGPIIYHSLSSTPFFFNSTGTENYITVYYANTGKTVGDFNLIIKFVNATFSAITEQPFTQINAASTQFRFDLNAGNSTSKDVYFSIDPNVSGFSISLSISSNQGSLKAIAEYPNFLQYTWNVDDFELTAGAIGVT